MSRGSELSGLVLAAMATGAFFPATALAERSTSGGGGGLLDAARSEVHGDSLSQPAQSSSPPASSDSGSGTEHGWRHDSDVTPARSMRATSSIHYPWSFRRYPYEAKLAGHLWLDGHPALSLPPDQTRAAARQRALSLQLAVEESYDFAGVHRPSASVRLETKWLLGLEGTWTHFIEPRPGGKLDHFGSGTFSLLLHARWNLATIWSGLGMRALIDPDRPDGDSGAALGWNGAMGLRLLPVRPLIFDTRLEYGSLGQAAVLHARGELGAVWHGIEPYAGYDYFSIGVVQFHGPLIGLRYWTG
jgi:hypothetical protein